MKETSGGSSSMSSSSPFGNINVGLIIVACVIALIVSLIIFVTIVKRKTAPKNKFARWLREYLNFRAILIADIIKYFYLLMATALTITGIIVMCQGQGDMVLPMIGIGFAIIIFGNIFLRILTELTMAIIVLWENTSDIRAVLVKEEEIAPEKPKKEPKPEEKPVEKEPEIPSAVPETVIAEETVAKKVQAPAPEPETPPTPETPQPSDLQI